MAREFTTKEYESYIKTLKASISETERGMKTLEDFKKVASFSFDEWVRFQNGELKIEECLNS